MKIHALYGLDLPTTTASGSGANPLVTRLPNGPWQTMMTNNDCSVSYSISTDGWVDAKITETASNYGNYRFRSIADIKEMISSVTPTSNLYFGVRVKTGSGFTGSNVVALTSGVDISNVVSLALTSDLPAYAIGKTYYVEFNLNFANNTIDRRVNGVSLARITMPTWMATAVSATPGGTSVYIGLGASQTNYSIQTGQTHTFSWRDLYCVEWESGEVAQFLGPQIVDKVPVSAVAASVWTPSTGDVTSVFKKGYSNPSTAISAPTATTDAAMTPGSITFDASAIPLNTKVLGVLVKGRSAVTGATTGHLGISAAVSGTETADVDTAMVAAQTWYDRMLSLTKTPAGLVWNQPSVAGLTINVKPKV